jgi:hypothetical protein
MSEALAGKVSVSKGQMSKYKHMTEEEIKDLYSYKNQFIDYISSIRNNCSVLNESFEGYIVLENKLNNISLESLLPYKYTSSYSSFSDNTLETLENKPKRTIIKVQESETKEVSDEELVSILDRMNNPDWYNEDGTKKNRLIIKTA